MPSPIGHALGGLIVAFAFASPRFLQKRHEGHEGSKSQNKFTGHDQIDRPAHRERLGLRERRGDRSSRALVAWCVVAACAPDIDFAWGRHNMETHSLAFAVLLGVLVLAWQRSSRLALACTLAACTHVLFDWLGSDDFPPLGVMALWPFSDDFYFADAYVFATISRRYWLPGFVSHNVMAVLQELVILTPVALVLWVWRNRSRAT